MRSYTTQMDAARRGLITPEMKAVAAKEYRTEEEIRDLVAKGQVASALTSYIPALIPTVLARCSEPRSTSTSESPAIARTMTLKWKK